ncbi:hypothetical protein [Candidatus Nardonella dryophthoridicola]|nr:hypothetical protein [Candidatus Nardonella dryophthoridicola]
MKNNTYNYEIILILNSNIENYENIINNILNNIKKFNIEIKNIEN